jgi:hypothetical protein
MKMISCNNWAPRNRKYHLWSYRYYYENMGIEVYIPELNKLHVPINVFYHRLGDVLYNILDEDGYFNEDY